MDRNLPAIAAAAATECIRQNVDQYALINLLTAHAHAYRLRHLTPTVESILTLGALVEPEVNRNGYRPGPASFADLTVAVAAREVPDAVERLVLFGLPGDTDDFVHHFLDVHPFKDGNGRVAWVLYAWLTGTLHEPLALPDYYGIDS